MKQQFKDRSTDATENIQFPTLPAKRSETEKMKAVEWLGTKSVRVSEVPKVEITDPQDVLVKITGTTICGSDLHLYHNLFPSGSMHKHDILGHEAVGIVESVGHQVKNIQPGDRVAISFDICCGQCQYCQREEYSLCDRTNPSKEMEAFYGSRSAGIFGYSHLLGGYEGIQAEYARVPYGDHNCLKLSGKLPDEVAVLLSDVACTAWHGNELAKVGPGDIVAVFGCGPVGAAAAMWASFRGASRVIVVDKEQYRLDLVAKNVKNVETVNISKVDVIKTIQKLVPHGVTATIECAGFRFPRDFLHKIQQKLRIETDDSQIIDDIFTVSRKHGRIALIGDYIGFANQFPIGMLHAKSLQLTGGQCFVQKYWKHLCHILENGEADLSWIITHRFPFEDAAKVYKMFDQHEDGIVKCFLKTHTQDTQAQ
uniref:Enoyl reductase (ER) domain-containing protein n=1 Tax=Percolomonas cosmopolitus TaxID=63605 RepID=A0A7S1KQG6_9EUKA|mmetsp:Transcript_5165/g.19367  ORF Transcript_5165/g.19367 Transcript_5165/m.19367 type:complete len:425 (+) Transcript_5165:1603-2877(+)|eukprot:CAMPEP_0117455364 /NCGR_PEP_ID=MMETSP0759-20121206/11319_1 /TAXON_ID=63605 /ORGANISM="Percolomonas cosmopolitus, Strain WS" /LENGTH=424 /DNA_ID=CAMNT_0005248661 /DNA_START=520 /DNA_END=1794 /DNA_ORIENTATION=+